MRQLTLWGGEEAPDGAAFFGRNKNRDDYEAFIEKFQPKKTTDDCYTPPAVYDAVAGWVEAEYGVGRERFVRPFYPGGDYERHEYPEGCAVVDNPPFSILADIVRFYLAEDVRFFLFAPALTLFNFATERCCAVCVGVGVTYENGAEVKTSFVTDMEGPGIRSAPELYRAVRAANDANRKERARTLPRYEYPDHVVTAAKLNYFSQYGVDFRAAAGEIARIDALEEQEACGKSIFGDGYLLSDAKAAEKAAAEKACERAKEAQGAEGGGVRKWGLSERERAICRRLGA